MATMQTIRAERYGGPEELKLVTAEVPKVGKDQVLLKVLASGVNPADTYLRSGMRKVAAHPWTPGSDASGVVEEVGEGVTHVKKGDRVFTSGTLTGAYSQYALASKNNTLILSDHLTFDQGAALYVPYYTAYHAIHHVTKASPRETLFVNGGSGAVGIASIQLATLHGIRVIATAGTDEGLRLAREAGASLVVNYKKEGYLNAILEFTGGKGPDVILEMLANVNLDSDCKLIAPKGRIAIIGSRGDVTITPRDLMYKRAAVLGVFLNLTTPEEMQEIHQGIAAAIALKKVKPHIGKIYSLAEADKAHVEVIAPSSGGAQGKIVLHPW